MVDWTRSEILSAAAISISAFALLIAGGSLWVAWLSYRRAGRYERPIFSATAKPLDGHPGWWEVNVKVRNRLPIGMACERIQVRWPRKIASRASFLDGEAWSPRLPDELRSKGMKRSISMDLAAAPAGSQSESRWRFYGTSDTHDEDFLVTGGPSGSARISISWSASDEAKRRQVSTFRIALPTDIRNASVRAP